MLIGKNTPDAMTLADYIALHDAIIHMSLDIEDSVPLPDDAEWDEIAAAKYALVQQMINCLNDVPSSRIDFYTKQGLKLPDVDYDFNGDEPRLIIDGKVIE